MKRLNVLSREYKIMLRADPFGGTEAEVLQAADRFWRDFAAAIEDVVPSVDGRLDTIEKRRTIRFFDTPEKRLRTNDYVFRERCDVDGSAREVTLKYRHPDRYLAEGRDMKAEHAERGKTKFEEDIKPPFLKLFSHSTKQPVEAELELDRMQRPAELFPDLAGRLDDFVEDEPLEAVGGFTAFELVVEGASFRIRKDPEIDADCGLVVWYDDANRTEPVVAEFSFKYESEDEEYTPSMARRAYDAFRSLQSLDAWIDPDSQTKTAFVYGQRRHK